MSAASRNAVLLAACLSMAAVNVRADSPQRTIADAARRVVKIHGAGGLRGLEAYQTGILVSPDGRIATALSTVLDSDEITCVLDDGRRFRATLVGVDPRREVAVLSIEAADLPAFALVGGPRLEPGVLGIVLVPDLLEKTPPFVDSVRADSAAARAGLRGDDLVIAVGPVSVASRAALERALGGLAAGDPVRLSVIRDGAIVECDLGPRPEAAR